MSIMITERQIKSRFQKRHVVKLVNELLAEKLYIATGEKPWFELKSGVTPEMIADSIRYSGIKEDKNFINHSGEHCHTMKICAEILRSVNGLKEWVNWVTPLRVFADDHYYAQGIIDMHNCTRIFKSEAEKVDYWIMWNVIRACSNLLRDNSVINVYI